MRRKYNFVTAVLLALVVMLAGCNTRTENDELPVSTMGTGEMIFQYGDGTVSIIDGNEEDKAEGNVGVVVQPDNAECSHTYGDWKTEVEATCSQQGSKVRTCSICGDTQTETVATIAHKATAVPGKEATCTETGLMEGEMCADCGEILYAQRVTAAYGHDEVYISARKATCAQEGKTEGRVCARCGLVFVEAQVIEKLDHSFGPWNTTQQPTCSGAGKEQRKCYNCGYTEEAQLSATGEHDYIAGVCAACGAEAEGSSFLTYRLSDDGTYYICTGTSVYSTQKEIIIPSYYNGKPVRQVGDGNCTFCSTYKLTVMEGITKIDTIAFYYNTKLKEVYLPSTLTYIGSGAFDYCTKLEAVYVSTSGWSQINEYTGKQFYVDLSDPAIAAGFLRDSMTVYYTR